MDKITMVVGLAFIISIGFLINGLVITPIFEDEKQLCIDKCENFGFSYVSGEASSVWKDKCICEDNSMYWEISSW